ncbi:uncharacterized protein FOBCDRAFT_148682, partial [Fusarium oxysporum Fo47]|uniref:uncharacterized protein n=1 Tax=Fusarium oxysporum Fo47 TaxID=660027 RepID=UPI002869AC90
LSKRDIPKAYSLIVIYLKKQLKARQFINKGFFMAKGESSTIKAFKYYNYPK